MEFMHLLKAFEKEKGWVDFQVESFNNFISFGIQQIVDEIDAINLSQSRETSNLSLEKYR